MEKLERVSWLVAVGLYPSQAAARMDILRGNGPPIIRKGRRIFLRPSEVERWLDLADRQHRGGAR